MSEEKKYYFAIDDVVRLRAKKVNGVIEFMPDEDSWEPDKNGFHYREVSRKFVDSPKKALINILILNSRDSNKPENVNHVLTNIVYDEKEQCFKWDEYKTLGTEKWPKPCQWEQFEKGEYTFYVDRHEVQILTADIAKFDLKEIFE